MSAVPQTNPSESLSGGRAYRLSELLSSVERVVRRTYCNWFWIVAEVAEYSYSPTRGYASFVLVEQNASGQRVAQVPAKLWRNNCTRVLREFECVTGSPISTGMQLMLQVQVSYSALYGLSLVIQDINAEHTLGRLESMRREAIARLEREGVLHLNKEHLLPDLCLRLAVITSATAAGWGDFRQQIAQSTVGTLFRLTLFPSTMQGPSTTPEVIRAFELIFGRLEEFDAVLILRGGGGKLDLSAFDEYHLCATIAQFPLPVLTGIGHERDVSVADLVAHTSLKTPTALAEFLIRRAQEALMRLADAEAAITDLLTGLLTPITQRAQRAVARLDHLLHQHADAETARLHRHTMAVDRATRTALQARRQCLDSHTTHLATTLRQQLTAQGNRLDHCALVIDRRADGVRVRSQRDLLLTDQLQARLTLLLRRLADETSRRLDSSERLLRSVDPTRLMQRGFLPVLHRGVPLTTVHALAPGEPLHIYLPDGELDATTTHTSLYHPQKESPL